MGRFSFRLKPVSSPTDLLPVELLTTYQEPVPESKPSAKKKKKNKKKPAKVEVKKKRKGSPFLLKEIKTSQSLPAKSEKKIIATQQVMNQIFSKIESHEAILQELLGPKKEDPIKNSLMPDETQEVEEEEEDRESEEQIEENGIDNENILRLLLSLNPATKVDSIVVNGVLQEVDIFISFNDSNQLAYFLHNQNVLVVDAHAIHEITFRNR